MQEVNGEWRHADPKAWPLLFRGKECRTTIETVADMEESFRTVSSSFGGIDKLSRINTGGRVARRLAGVKILWKEISRRQNYKQTGAIRISIMQVRTSQKLGGCQPFYERKH